jgi:hypothetical protein
MVGLFRSVVGPFLALLRPTGSADLSQLSACDRTSARLPPRAESDPKQSCETIAAAMVAACSGMLQFLLPLLAWRGVWRTQSW